MYTSRGNRHRVTIDNKTFWVDSNQEEALIRWLEENDFHDRWKRPELGIQVGSYRYTPDLEVSILEKNGRTTRAIVESKPTMAHLSETQKKAMRKTAKFYGTKVLLLYTHDFKSWQSIDIKTGEILSEAIPIPGKIPINKLYKPLTRKGSQVFSHKYMQRLELGKRSLLFVLDFIENSTMTLARSIFSPSKGKNRKSKRKKKR